MPRTWNNPASFAISYKLNSSKIESDKLNLYSDTREPMRCRTFVDLKTIMLETFPKPRGCEL